MSEETEITLALICIQAQANDIGTIAFHTGLDMNYISIILKHIEPNINLIIPGDIVDYCNGDRDLQHIMFDAYNNGYLHNRHPEPLTQEQIDDLETMPTKLYTITHKIQKWKIPYLRRIYFGTSYIKKI